MSRSDVSAVMKQAQGQWPHILDCLGIAHSQKHTPCPACGGKDRFRFDDIEGRGTWICNQCGAGDGLDLVKLVFQSDTRSALKQVAEVLNITELEPRKTLSAPECKQDIADKVNQLLAKTKTAESPYLVNKELFGYSLPMLNDDKLVLTLIDVSKRIQGAQFISSDGTKKLLAGTKKKGVFIALSDLPETANVIILTEGYATALSVALMNPEAFIVAAIDAGNLIHIANALRNHYPNAEIIIAADNDLKQDEKNIGKEAAEKVALSIKGKITLPSTDYKTDWDDYRQQFGIEKAKQAFLAGMYEPKNESEVQLNKSSGKDCLKPYVDIRYGGLYWIEPKTDRDTGEVIERESWLCDPLTIAGIGEDDNERYLIIQWKPEGSLKERIEALPMRDIGEREGWAKLRAGGLAITAKSGLRAILADYLQRSGSRELWSIANSTGWQCGAYIMPDGTIIGEPEKPVLFNGRSATAKGYQIKGTVGSWRDSVARLTNGNPSMMLGIACAFAAPLIGLVNADGFGVHLFGGSSAGKTTTGNIATSVYGEPEALKLTWYSTALGLVNEAAAHNDGFMPLDEIGQGSNRRDVCPLPYN